MWLRAGGYVRTYVLHLPPALLHGQASTQKAPLVVGLHGHYGNGGQFLTYTKLAAETDPDGVVAAFPDGLVGATGEAGRGWADGRHPDLVDDIQFVREVLADVTWRLPIDRSRIFATGMSNGGILTQRLACQMSDVFAAVASDVAALAAPIAQTCAPIAPVAVLGIEGVADPIVPVGGGTVDGGGGTVLSGEATMQLWAQKNGCPVVAAKTMPLPAVNDGTSVTRYVFAPCASGAEVDWYLVAGMQHVWPPEPDTLLGVKTSQNLNATHTIWEFFKAHSRAEPTCVPTTCAALGKNCGAGPDGCGALLSCGSCTGIDTAAGVAR